MSLKENITHGLNSHQRIIHSVGVFKKHIYRYIVITVIRHDIYKFKLARIKENFYSIFLSYIVYK